jgi:hypothetical protein
MVCTGLSNARARALGSYCGRIRALGAVALLVSRRLAAGQAPYRDPLLARYVRENLGIAA